MTQDQLMALLRQILPIIGTLSVMLGVSQATATAWVNLALTVGGPVILVGSTIWSFIANSKASILTSAANMNEVKEVVLKQNAPATLVDATPNNVSKG